MMVSEKRAEIALERGIEAFTRRARARLLCALAPSETEGWPIIFIPEQDHSTQVSHSDQAGGIKQRADSDGSQ